MTEEVVALQKPSQRALSKRKSSKLLIVQYFSRFAPLHFLQ
jgi:hypothetical protein